MIISFLFLNKIYRISFAVFKYLKSVLWQLLTQWGTLSFTIKANEMLLGRAKVNKVKFFSGLCYIMKLTLTLV